MAKASGKAASSATPPSLSPSLCQRVPNDYTLVSDLDRQFGDVPVGLRKILLSLIHGFATEKEPR